MTNEKKNTRIIYTWKNSWKNILMHKTRPGYIILSKCVSQVAMAASSFTLKKVNLLNNQS